MGPAEDGTPPAIRANSPGPDVSQQEHEAGPAKVRGRPQARSGDAGPAAPAAGARRRNGQ